MEAMIATAIMAGMGQRQASQGKTDAATMGAEATLNNAINKFKPQQPQQGAIQQHPMLQQIMNRGGNIT